jgi:flagellar hook-associated protein 1 FlgK
MSGLTGSILSTTNALKANEVAIQTAGKNMNNVNNAAYSRQRVEFGISGGISQTIVTQQRDTIIESKIVRESSLVGSLDAQSRIYDQLQVIFGEEISQNVDTVETLAGSTTESAGGSGLSSMVDDFFNAFHSLSADPDDIPTKAALLAEAEELVSRMNSMASDLEELDNDVQRAIGADITQVNSLLSQVASLNQEIAKIEIRDPGTAYEFRDLRQQKLEELANYLEIETVEANNGQVLVYARDKSSSAGSQITLVDRNNVSNRVAFNEASNEVYFTNYTTRPLGNSPNATAVNLKSGSLHGYVYARSTTDPYGDPNSQAIGPLAKMRQDLDTLANELATQVNGLYNDAPNDIYFFDDDGDPDAPDLTNLTAANITLYKGDPRRN